MEKLQEEKNAKLYIHVSVENLLQNAESAEVSDIGLTAATSAVFGQPNILFTFAPPDLLSRHQFSLFKPGFQKDNYDHDNDQF